MPTILIVDDKYANRLALTALLDSAGHRVLEASNGFEALAVARSESPELIITDLVMPEMDGYELVQQLRSGSSAVRSQVIFYSATYDEKEARELARSCGVFEFLPKPSEPEVIRNVVTAALNSPIPVSVPADGQEKFDRAHLQVMTNKLHRKVRELEIANHELHLAGEELERRVEERTAQLAKTNERLQSEVAERERAERAARKARAEAERANVAKSEFLSGMSHELRTPLNAILGFAQLLELEMVDPGQRDSLQHILKGGNHLLELINEVLDLAKIESGRIDLAIEPVDLGELLTETISLMRPLAAEGGIQMVEPAAPAFAVKVRADRQRLKQVLLNLLSNAIKYNRRGGSAIIACRAAAGDRLRISVIDTGAGISEENLARLFRPFERLGAENSAIEGTGLGLSLCKQLIESMHGSIEAESMLGRGSSFSVTLPVAAEPVTDNVAALKGDTRAPLKTILYIEDNLSCVEIIEQLLSRRPDVKLLAAAQGALGIDLARAHRPDLILLDLRLPDINGEEVLKELRRDSRTSALPVVLISGETSPEQIERLLKAGASEHVAKPLDIPRFFTVLDQILQPSPARVRISDVWPDSA